MGGIGARNIRRQDIIEDRFTQTTDGERALIVGVILPLHRKWEVDASLDELALLADTAGAVVVDRVIQERSAVNPKFFIGGGKAEQIAELVKTQEIDLVIFDDDLSPAQMRNLEEVIETRILDRSGLILDIFASRARTREAKTQVELAQLEYLMPRLTRRWTHLSRQAGGIGTRGPGIGARGPGETQLEVDRRKMRKRLSDLAKSLETIAKRRGVERKGRRDEFKVTFVGYTNAGKSTLMHALSGAEVFVENRLFATLDSTTRAVDLGENRKILLTDTVGFIRKLPHHLMASFRSTLEEAVEADLLLHVVDVSHPLCEDQVTAANEVLDDLEILEHPTVIVFNKVDLLNEPGILDRLRDEYPDSVVASGVTGYGLEEIRRELRGRIDESRTVLDLRIGVAEGKVLAHLYDVGEVLSQEYEGAEVVMRVRLSKAEAHRAKKWAAIASDVST